MGWLILMWVLIIGFLWPIFIGNALSLTTRTQKIKLVIIGASIWVISEVMPAEMAFSLIYISTLLWYFLYQGPKLLRERQEWIAECRRKGIKIRNTGRRRGNWGIGLG